MKKPVQACSAAYEPPIQVRCSHRHLRHCPEGHVFGGENKNDPWLRAGARCPVYILGDRCPGRLVRIGPGSRKARAV